MLHIGPYIGLATLFATTVFVAWKGGPPERIGTAMILFAWVGTIVAEALAHAMFSLTWLMVFDGLLAVGFLIIAVRYSSLWLGGAMICQAISFGSYAFRLIDNTRAVWRGQHALIVINNLISYLVLFILIGGTIATILRRRRADREKVEDRARIVKRPDWLTDMTPPTAGAL